MDFQFPKDYGRSTIKSLVQGIRLFYSSMMCTNNFQNSKDICAILRM